MYRDITADSRARVQLNVVSCLTFKLAMVALFVAMAGWLASFLRLLVCWLRKYVCAAESGQAAKAIILLPLKCYKILRRDKCSLFNKFFTTFLCHTCVVDVTCAPVRNSSS